jgi:hypothetical protein
MQLREEEEAPLCQPYPAVSLRDEEERTLFSVLSSANFILCFSAGFVAAATTSTGLATLFNYRSPTKKNFQRFLDEVEAPLWQPFQLSVSRTKKNFSAFSKKKKHR